jgi:uncharacterized membrane protein YccC
MISQDFIMGALVGVPLGLVLSLVIHPLGLAFAVLVDAVGGRRGR